MKTIEKAQYLTYPLASIRRLVYDWRVLSALLFLGPYRYSQKWIEQKNPDYKYLADEYLAAYIDANLRRKIFSKKMNSLANKMKLEEEFWDSFSELCGFATEEYTINDRVFFALQESVHEYFENHPFNVTDVRKWYAYYHALKAINLDFAAPMDTYIEFLEVESRNININIPPYFTLNTDFMWSIYKAKETTYSKEDERAALAMYMGILTLIGNKEYIATTSDMIKCRMFGFKSPVEIEEIETRIESNGFKSRSDSGDNMYYLDDTKLIELYKKHTTRRKYDRYLRIVQQKYGIKELGTGHRTYLSTKLSVVQLAHKIAKKQDTAEGTELKKEKQKAIDVLRKAKRERKNIKPEVLPDFDPKTEWDKISEQFGSPTTTLMTD